MLKPRNKQQNAPLLGERPYSALDSVPKWARALLSVLTGGLCFAVLGLACYGAYRLMEPEKVPASSTQHAVEESSSEESSQLPLPPTQQEPVAIGPELDVRVETRSPESEVSLTDEDGNQLLTPAQVTSAVLPSVVGINTAGRTGSEYAAVGSGFVLSKDGYIVTCAHLVENAQRVSVTLSNGRQRDAVLAGIDARTDIAVLKISESSLIPVTFTDSASLAPGAEVIAIGNPGGSEFTGSVTNGILSSPAREVGVSETSYYTVDALQITAAIDPGNTGGPLCDTYGNVIGLCSDLQRDEEYPSAYFAIPSSLVVPIAEDLVRYGRVTGRVWLGIGAVALSEATAKLNNLPAGIMVTTIYDGSNLTDAGVQPNDIILTIDGKSMSSLDALRDFLDSHSPGDLVTLTVYRRGEPASLSSGAASDSSYEEGYLLQIYLYLLEDNGSLVGAFVPELE